MDNFFNIKETSKTIKPISVTRKRNAVDKPITTDKKKDSVIIDEPVIAEKKSNTVTDLVKFCKGFMSLYKRNDAKLQKIIFNSYEIKLLKRLFEMYLKNNKDVQVKRMYNALQSKAIRKIELNNKECNKLYYIIGVIENESSNSTQA
jgi:hypothetical protein